MTFFETELSGVFAVGLQEHADERGYFARIWCPKEFARHGLNPNLAQVSASFNTRAGTLRGMHYQVEPFAEAKLIRVTSGGIWDVALDLRPTSPTYLRWFGTELSASNRRMLYIPEGCAHGFQTLSDHTEVVYHISAEYEPASARGALYNDPAFGIAWPLPVGMISQRDREWPEFQRTGKG